jgi:N-acetyl sugar amidotransferase
MPLLDDGAMNLVRCKTCVMPNTRPDTPFVDGECSACVSYRARKAIDWQQRMATLTQILDTAKRNSSGFDCIVPSSGGKDSTYQVTRLILLGVKPLIVTATTCHLTRLGRANIDNLARYATTIEVTPNRDVRRALNRKGLELVGDISWPEHASIFSAPLRMAVHLGIPTIFYGENPQEAYGGPLGSEQAEQMTRRWISEFGGFLGLRAKDMVDSEITERHMKDYIPPSQDELDRVGVRAYFLGQFEAWDSRRNAERAMQCGMRTTMMPPTPGNWWVFENLDNAQTGLHDWFMFLKYGFGRGCQQISVDVRSGYIERERALRWVEAHDGLFPESYAGVSVYDVLGACGINVATLRRTAERFRNPNVCWRQMPKELQPS